MEKCYNFEINVLTTFSGYVFAKNEQEARTKIIDGNYDEATIIDSKPQKIIKFEEDKISSTTGGI